ncbi:siderophore-interacting protein [Cellulosimicrobium sp. CUA-896]|uniref:siderophore-interacting protein n=1 Tax=Cellulosimicrobium sp. CUA-896 TaxID=1517881 RepID=UPI003519BB75
MGSYKIVKPADAHVLTLEVVGTERVTPSMVRVTLGGEGMDHFTPMGFDQWFRLFLARPDQESLRLRPGPPGSGTSSTSRRRDRGARSCGTTPCARCVPTSASSTSTSSSTATRVRRRGSR